MARVFVKSFILTTELKSVRNSNYYNFEFWEFTTGYYWLPTSISTKYFCFWHWFFFSVIVYPTEIAFLKGKQGISSKIGTNNSFCFGYQLRQDDVKETQQKSVCIDISGQWSVP